MLTILRRAGETATASRLEELAEAMRADFNRHLIRDGVLAGYAIFNPARRACSSFFCTRPTARPA